MHAGVLPAPLLEAVRAALLRLETVEAEWQGAQDLLAAQLVGQQAAALQPALQSAAQLADLLLQCWALPAQMVESRLELAQAAATRSCAFLGCSNLSLEGGPAAGEGAGSLKCAGCRSVWYCGTTCSHADWRAGHKRVCKVLAAARQQARQQQAAAE
jgi:hypothetical protein